MSTEDNNFFDPKTGKPVDRDWLDLMIGLFVTGKTDREVKLQHESSPRSEREIYQQFAGPQGASSFYFTRPSWEKKARKAKRDMIAASMRRLIFVGKIRVVRIIHPNHKSMHGIARQSSARDMQVFGKGHDGLIRIYGPATILDALAGAMGESE